MDRIHTISCAFSIILLFFMLPSSGSPSYTTGADASVPSNLREEISFLFRTDSGKGYFIPGNSGAMCGFRTAAERGDARAQFNLGLLYSSGESILRDEREAVKWVTKAAMQGLAEAQFKLGTMYFIGEIVPQDEREAAKWFAKAARRGLAAAQFNLAAMYSAGEGVPRDEQEAEKWFTRAAEQGDVKAQKMLGVMYLKREQSR